MKPALSALLIVVLALAAAVGGFQVARWVRGGTAAVAAVSAPDLLGKTAAALALDGIDGERVDLAAFRGKTVLLNFWASWCGPCVEEMPVLDRFAQKHNADIVVIGVAVEDHDDARAFLAKHPVSYRIALGSAESPDESAAFGNYRNVLPYSVLIDAEGIVRRAEARTFDEGDLDSWVNWGKR
jgi:thiol-disulfide isomerase/thioredoxin